MSSLSPCVPTLESLVERLLASKSNCSDYASLSLLLDDFEQSYASIKNATGSSTGPAGPQHKLSAHLNHGKSSHSSKKKPSQEIDVRVQELTSLFTQVLTNDHYTLPYSTQLNSDQYTCPITVLSSIPITFKTPHGKRRSDYDTYTAFPCALAARFFRTPPPSPPLPTPVLLSTTSMTDSKALITSHASIWAEQICKYAIETLHAHPEQYPHLLGCVLTPSNSNTVRAGSIEVVFKGDTAGTAAGNGNSQGAQAQIQLSSTTMTDSDDIDGDGSDSIAKKRKQQPPSSPNLYGNGDHHGKSNIKLQKPSSHQDGSTQLISITDNRFNSTEQQQQQRSADLESCFDFSPTTVESRHCMNPNTMGLQEYKFTAMGYINSCFRLKYSTPRQGSVVPSSQACLTLHQDVRADAVLGLQDYSHVWLFFVFHHNAQSKYKPKVQPPRLNGIKMGCLSTRTPHRFNDIGLSLVKLERIEYPQDFTHLPKDAPQNNFNVYVPSSQSKATKMKGCVRLIFSGIDLVDGTPILDIKPFHPSDMVDPQLLRLPKWLTDLPFSTLQVTFHPNCIQDLIRIFKQYYLHQLLALQRQRQKKQQQQQPEHGADQDTNDNELIELISHVTENYTTATEEQFQTIHQRFGSPLQFYESIPAIMQAIRETLSMDPRPICTKKRTPNGIYGFVYDNLNVIYQMTQDNVATVCLFEQRDQSNVVINRNREILNKSVWLQKISQQISSITDQTESDQPQ